MSGIRLLASNPIDQIDAIFVDRVFQPMVDWMEIDPRRASVIMLILNAVSIAAMHSGASAMEASGMPVMSHFETTVGLPAFGLFQLAFLWTCIRSPSFFGSVGLDGMIRVMYLSFSILAMTILPRALFGEADPEFLDVAGRTPIALREVVVAFVFVMITAAAGLYLSVCRRPPPKRKTAWA